MICPLDFETKFYSLEKLLALTTSSDDTTSSRIFKKILQGKIMLDSLRLIPLATNLYGVYDKATCIIDDEARADCFSDRKTIKNVFLYNPYNHDKSLWVLQKMLKTPTDLSVYQAISITWIYDLPKTPFFKTIVKLQMLCFRFKTSFPKLVPTIYELLVIQTEKKLKICTIFEKFSLEKVTPELTYVINYKNFIAHLHELYFLANSLFEQKLSHGDLTSSNLVLKKQGGIKCLLDFDTAASLTLLQGRYVKNWIYDLLNIIKACAFYQIKEGQQTSWPSITLEMTDDECDFYQKSLIAFEKLYSQLKEFLVKYGLIADTTYLEASELRAFLELTDPKKIFLGFIGSYSCEL